MRWLAACASVLIAGGCCAAIATRPGLGSSGLVLLSSLAADIRVQRARSTAVPALSLGARIPAPEGIWLWLACCVCTVSLDALSFLAPRARAASACLVRLFQPTPYTYAAGAMAGCAGCTLFLAAMSALGPSHSPCYSSRVPAQVTQSGPYVLVRHPLYVAYMLILLGVVLAALTLCVLVSAYFM